MGEFMNYAAEMAEGGIIQIPSFTKIGPGVQICFREDTYTDRQTDTHTQTHTHTHTHTHRTMKVIL
jgi:hypothetical protein